MSIGLLWRKAVNVVGRDEVAGIQRLARLASLAADYIISRRPGLNSFWLRTDAENWSISRFLKSAADEISEGSLVFDAGAGSSPYLPYFRGHRYQSCDAYATKGVTYIADVHRLPVVDSAYDVVVCTQVLEHVQYPQQVLKELNRVLRPGGSLFLTAPQGWGLHYEPNNFFNFTRYGLDLLFRDAGFRVVSIRERGGVFWYLGKRLRSLVPYLYQQYHGTGKLLMFVFYLISQPVFRYALPMTLFYLDSLDKKQGYTLGYACICTKPA